MASRAIVVGPLVAARPYWWVFFQRSNKLALGSVLLMILLSLAAAAPIVARHDPAEMQVATNFQPPGPGLLFGADEYGRDILSRVIYGIRVSIGVAIAIAGLSLAVGAGVGLMAGYFGGILDDVVMRITDVLFGTPGTLLALFFATIVGPGLRTVIIALTIVYAREFARLARGTAMSVRQQPFVEAARVSGESNMPLLFRYVLPNTLAPLIINTAIVMSYAILDEAALSYLGLGTQAPTPSWGLMLSTGQRYIFTSPHVAMFPGAAIAIAVLTFNLLGDGLRDALDPRLRRVRR
jgi:peptide/nickel transport system permease protein